MAYRSPNLEPYQGSLLPPNSFYSTDTSYTTAGGIRRAMSVMSSSSYQYTVEEDDTNSIQSAPPPPDTELHLSKQDLAMSIESYDSLLKAAQVYQDTMKQLSSAAAGFGYALERVARGRGASDAGQGLQAAAGLQFLISNHQQILSDMFNKSLEVPLKENLDHHRKTVEQSQENYEAALKLMSKKIRDTEARNMKNGRKGQRDIRQFRKALQDLTRQVDELDRIKTDYHRHMAEVERRNHYCILSKVATVVRAQVDIYERISNKGLADPMLEQMMHQNPDPFCAYSSPTDESTEIFTVLPPVSLIDYPPQTPLTAFDADDYGLYASGAVTPIPQEDEELWQQKQLHSPSSQQTHHSLTSSQNHHSHHHNHHRSSTEEEEEKQQQNSNLSINTTTTTTTTTEVHVEETKEKPKIGLPPQQQHDDDRSSSVSSGDESTQTTQVRKETSVGGHHTCHHHHPSSPPLSSLPPPPSQHDSLTLDST
ncbi:hypothetical protein BDA99DRAFT_510825 [Phascolomyces articulosus]|uniref:IMD domain-containing protein n=1 Tax=Phascolomyces articulosus TaxID=60185 RepID=A0AAD5K9F8_9FUNG|nr:hypothetical protein BDA99DRAFT_510825 [Phascolomyces articulosus]